MLLALLRSRSNRDILRWGSEISKKALVAMGRRYIAPGSFHRRRSRTTTPEKRVFTFIIPAVPPPPLFLFTFSLHVITVSRRRDGPSSTHQRSELEELDDNNNQRKKLPRKYVQYDMKKHCVGDETQADHRSRSYQEERGRGNIYEAGRKKRVSTERIYPERLPRCLVALCTCVRSRWWCLSLQSFSMNEIGARFTVLSMEYRCRGGGSTIRSVDPCARRA